MKKSVLIILHAVFWGILLSSNAVFMLLFRGIPLEDYGKATQVAIYLIPAGFYLSYFGIKYLLKKNKYIIYTIVIILCSLLILFIFANNKFNIVVIISSKLILWFLFGGLFRFFTDWLQKREKYNLLEKQKLVSELSLLRIQINPHFLFNTLHNIDSMIKKKPDTASRSLIKLSDIMRYMLYEADNESVLLSNEIRYINNYIDLQKLRYSESVKVEWNVNGEPGNLKIAPMLFISFLENAFKHGDIESEKLSVNLNIESSVINFYCANYISNNSQDKDNTKGIGLETVKKRLNLIYPKNHKLDIKQENNIFEVNLEIRPTS